MTEVIFIRHGQTPMNAKPDLIGGQNNQISITLRGAAQSIGAGQWLKQQHFFPDIVYASTARRAQLTADFCLTIMGLWPGYVTDERFLELSQGDAENKPRIGIYTTEVLKQIKIKGKDFSLPGAESMRGVGLRGIDGLNATIEARPEVKRILIFAHGGLIKYIASELEDWTQQQTYETEIGNCSANSFVHGSSGWMVNYLNKATSDV